MVAVFAVRLRAPFLSGDQSLPRDSSPDIPSISAARTGLHGGLGKQRQGFIMTGLGQERSTACQPCSISQERGVEAEEAVSKGCPAWAVWVVLDVLSSLTPHIHSQISRTALCPFLNRTGVGEGGVIPVLTGATRPRRNSPLWPRKVCARIFTATLFLEVSKGKHTPTEEGKEPHYMMGTFIVIKIHEPNPHTST